MLSKYHEPFTGNSLSNTHLQTDDVWRLICPLNTLSLSHALPPSKGRGNKGNMEPPPTFMNGSTCLRLGETHAVQVNLCLIQEGIQTAILGICVYSQHDVQPSPDMRTW